MKANYNIRNLSKNELALAQLKGAVDTNEKEMLSSMADYYKFAAHDHGPELPYNEFANGYLKSLAENALESASTRQLRLDLLIDYEAAIEYIKSVSVNNEDWWETYVRDEEAIVGEIRDDLPPHELFEEPEKPDNAPNNMSENIKKENTMEKKFDMKKIIHKIFEPIAKLFATLNKKIGEIKEQAKKNWKAAKERLLNMWEKLKLVSIKYILPAIGIVVAIALMTVVPVIIGKLMVPVIAGIANATFRAIVTFLASVAGGISGMLGGKLTEIVLSKYFTWILNRGTDKEKARAEKIMDAISDTGLFCFVEKVTVNG